MEGSVINAGFCLALAQAMGMPAAQAQIFRVADRHVLLVARFDRLEEADRRLLRIHQEDFCQTLGVVPEMKYQNEGGPYLRACFGLLRNAIRPSAPQVLRLVEAVVFNALIGNHDAHAKNFALLYAGKTPYLAPLYDLQSTAVYDHHTPKMAMKVGSKYTFSEVQARHWMQFAVTTGLSKAQTKKTRAAPGARLAHCRAPTAGLTGFC